MKMAETSKAEATKKKTRISHTKEPAFERTLAIIKPNAISKVKHIEVIIEKEGLFVLHKKKLYLNRKQAIDFFVKPLEDEKDKMYEKLYEDLKKNRLRQVSKEERSANVPPIFKVEEETEQYTKQLIDFLTSGPIEVLVLAGRGAVYKWQEIMGPPDPKIARLSHPTSIRARYGGETSIDNAVHGSESKVKAEREIRFFFPDARFEADFKLGASGEYLSRTVNPILLKGLIQLCRQKPDNPLVWLADWLLANNPNARMYV